MVKAITSIKEKLNPDKFKNELLSELDPKLSFKDGTGALKGKINDFLKSHFSTESSDQSKKQDIKKVARQMPKVSSKITSRFDGKKTKPRKLPQLLNDLSLKLGYESSSKELHKSVLKYDAYFCIFISLIVAAFVVVNGKSLDIFVTFLIGIWTLCYAGLYLLSMLCIFWFFDLRMYQHVKQIEEALPDFLQLASANISAGMTVDRALWYAVRPKFGILAVEMESVAKATIAGEELEKALVTLGSKYDSRVLKETINLIVEGISSGGQMAELLNKLSGNIKETQLMKKEISASVTTYAIFIGIATVIAAPILFALSTELLTIIKKIFSSIHIDNSVGASSLFSFNFSGESIAISTFKNFAILVLIIS